VRAAFAQFTDEGSARHHHLRGIVERDRSWRSKLPALLNDILIALCARRIGATLLTYNGKDFRLIRRHKEFALRVLAADAE
jgi:predicted nucleic acid-binding protein